MLSIRYSQHKKVDTFDQSVGSPVAAAMGDRGWLVCNGPLRVRARVWMCVDVDSGGEVSSSSSSSSGEAPSSTLVSRQCIILM